MLKRQSFKYRLKVSPEQSKALLGYVGSCRFVYNQALKLQVENHLNGNKYIPCNDMINLLPAWKKVYSWLKDPPAQGLQQALMRLDKAFQTFFAKTAGHPKPRKRGLHMSMTLPQGFKLDQGNGRIKIPKLGWLKYISHRKIIGKPKNITISKQADHWYVSVQCEQEVGSPIPTAKKAVGIDMGIASFATLSDGSVVAPLNSFKAHALKLKKAQRKLSSKIKFSKNWRKALRRVQRVHAKIANCRRDFLHKTTTAISKNHALVVIEDLKVKNMSRSAKGTLAEPGKNVKAKSGLNRSILDQGWGEFRRQLEYKLTWNGGLLIAVPPHHTSQTCPQPDCGHVDKANRKTQAKFACVSCGYTANADYVGATNILARGLRVVACGDSGYGVCEAGTVLQG